MRLLSGEEMHRLDTAAVEDYSIPSTILMENAGLALLAAAEEMLGAVVGHKIIIFAGGGNNGGDGLVLARHLYNRGANVRVFLAASAADLRGDVLANWRILTAMGLDIKELSDMQQLNVLRIVVANADLLVDALVGTGLHGPVEGIRSAIINLLNECSRPVLACDIPSGLCAHSGQPLGAAVRADRTVTLAFCKLGLVLPPAAPYVGKLTVADISLPLGIDEILTVRRDLVDADFCRRFIKPRPIQSNKRDFGHMLLLAGAPQMPGAPVLAAKGAFNMGIGLVTAAVPQAAALSFCAQVPEAMLFPCRETSEGLIASSEKEKLAAKRADVFLLGPGLGRSDNTMELVRELLPLLSAPIVLDADGLYAFNGRIRDLAAAQKPLIITPHAAEMARLLAMSVREVQKDRIATALFAAQESNAVVVLKGPGTVTATPEGRVFINSSGNPGMATAGSGDVLAGMIGALLAQKLPPALAASIAVWVHGTAGDLAARKKNQVSISAGDIIASIADAYNKIVIDRGSR
ncbi:MAG: NAD(P)H-hydrate dehydratase [Bacillota bacterium]